MTARSSRGLAFLCALCIAGCATQQRVAPSAQVTSPRSNIITADRTKDAVVVGKSTKADVLASLGKSLVISFDTGFEIWIYRLADDTRAGAAVPRRVTGGGQVPPDRRAEFVVLFAPSGVVAKTRIRPAPQPSPQG